MVDVFLSESPQYSGGSVVRHGIKISGAKFHLTSSEVTPESMACVFAEPQYAASYYMS